MDDLCVVSSTELVVRNMPTAGVCVSLLRLVIIRTRLIERLEASPGMEVLAKACNCGADVGGLIACAPKQLTKLQGGSLSLADHVQLLNHRIRLEFLDCVPIIGH